MLPGVVVFAPLAFCWMAMRSSSRMGAASPNAVSMGAPPSVAPRAHHLRHCRASCAGGAFAAGSCCPLARPPAAEVRLSFVAFCSLSSFCPEEYTHTLVVAGGSRVQRGLRLHKCGRQRRLTATPAKPAASAPASVAASFVRPSAVALSCLPSASTWLNLCRR